MSGCYIMVASVLNELKSKRFRRTSRLMDLKIFNSFIRSFGLALPRKLYISDGINAIKESTLKHY